MPQHKKISTTELRHKNRNNIYHYFYHVQQPKTKQDIAQKLSFSLPTVTQNLNELLDAGLIEYAGLEDSNGGRRARTMQLVANARIAVGIELSRDYIRLVAIDLYGTEIAYQSISCVFAPNDAYRKQIAELLERFLDEFSLDRTRLLGVGITLPGIINEKTGMIEAAPVLGVRQMETSFLTELIPYPVFVGNDASDAGYAECWNRNQQDTLAYVFLGKGVGGALVIQGKPYTGQNYRSAEFGHICIVPNGKLCNCGRRGCFEAYCSVSCISDALGIQLEEFFVQLHAGNLEYQSVFDTYLEYLVCGVHTIRMVMDCDIVLGGEIVSYLEPYLGLIREKLAKKDCFDADCSYLRLGICGTKASCIGAALHYVADFIQVI